MEKLKTAVIQANEQVCTADASVKLDDLTACARLMCCSEVVWFHTEVSQTQTCIASLPVYLPPPPLFSTHIKMSQSPQDSDTSEQQQRIAPKPLPPGRKVN